MKMVEGKTYRVFWHDTLAIEAWCDWERIETTAKECGNNQETVGVYIGTTNNYHVLASTINKSKEMLPFSNVSMIPVGCTVSVKKL